MLSRSESIYLILCALSVVCVPIGCWIYINVNKRKK